MAGLLAYEHLIVSPGNLGRLDAAFFTVNGVISIVFFAFVAADVLVSVIRARGVEKRYGSRRVLSGIDIELPRDGFLVVTGANGSGKTTLLRVLTGLAAPTRGTVEVERRREHDSASSPTSRSCTGSSPRSRTSISSDGSTAFRSDGSGSGCCSSASASGRLARSGCSSYSRGMSQRLALCRALLHDPELLVLDEPYASLDEQGGALLDRELEELAGSRTLVVSTHDPARVERLATQRLALA